MSGETAYGAGASGAATVEASEVYAQIVARAQSAGMSLRELSARLALLPPEALDGGLPRVARWLPGEGEPCSADRIRLEIDLLGLVAPERYGELDGLRAEIIRDQGLSPRAAGFAASADLVSKLRALLLSRFSPDVGPPADGPRSDFAFLKTSLLLLESWTRLATEDPNLALVFDAVARHGSLQRYYAADPVPLRAVQRLVERGFDAEHIVFGRGEVHSVGARALERPDAWPPRVLRAVRRVLGRREGGGLEGLGVPHGRLYHALRADVRSLKETGSVAAGERLLGALLPVVDAALDRAQKRGSADARWEMTHVQMELQYLLGAAGRASGPGAPSPRRIRAIRSPKQVPEILFDNKRFACCLFKPAGLFHGEISRLLLDPATPMLEIWSDPYAEFLGLVTLYPGIDKDGEPVVLVDTFDYDDRLHDFLGYNPTLRFVLDAVVVDARRAGARRVVVFAAPYGKPIGFANFVRYERERRRSIRYLPSYSFESVDPFDVSLARSRACRHHYTVALGYDRPMRGVIDYGFNYVAPGRVDKYYEGGRGVFVVDVDGYLRERRLSGEDRRRMSKAAAGQSGPPVPPSHPSPSSPAPASPSSPAPASPPSPEPASPPPWLPAIHRPPEHHAAELRCREEAALREARGHLRPGGADGIALRVRRDPDDGTIASLLEIEAAAFPSDLRYDAAALAERMLPRDAQVITAEAEDGRLLGFALMYCSPYTSVFDAYLDDLAVRPECQGSGIGRALLDAAMGLATIGGYRRFSLLARHRDVSDRLATFYRNAGLRPSGFMEGRGFLYQIGLGLHGPWAAPRVEAVLDGGRSALAGLVDQPRLTRHGGHDIDLVATMLAIEAAFPEELRYDREQFMRRLGEWDATVLQVRDGEQPIAFSLSYQDPILPLHAVFLDSMCVEPSCQKRGIGSILHRANLALHPIAGYTSAVFYCEPRNRDGVDLVALYGRHGGKIVSRGPDRVQMTADLRRQPSV